MKAVLEKLDEQREEAVEDIAGEVMLVIGNEGRDVKEQYITSFSGSR